MEESRYLESGKAYAISQLRRNNGLKNKYGESSFQPFVTFSRQPGAGSGIIADKLIKYLEINDRLAPVQWSIFDKALIHQFLIDEELQKDILESVPEREYTHIGEVFEELFGVKPSRLQLIKKTNHAIQHLAKRGNVILLGAGSYIITRKIPGGFHVRVIGSEDNRINHLEEFYGMARKQAMKYMKREDDEREKYIKKVFRKDLNDNLLYDLVINTDHLSDDDAAELIGSHVVKIRSKLGENAGLFIH
jgi:cytidylate kinase